MTTTKHANTAKKDYVIWTFSLQASNGLRVLHFLADNLRNAGYNVYLYSSEPYSDGYQYVDKITNNLRNNAIVIYPEIVLGNPLRFKNVVRYVLYYPGLNGGNECYHNSEQIFAFLPQFYPSVPVLTVPYLDKTLFYNDGKDKDIDCYFVNKGGKFREVEEIKGATEITMNSPSTREELAMLLRRTKTLYSFDDCSAILDEALVCGAIVKIITEDGLKDYISQSLESIKSFPQQFENFISATQKANYSGPLEPAENNHWRNIQTRIKYIISKYIVKNPDRAFSLKNGIRGFSEHSFRPKKKK